MSGLQAARAFGFVPLCFRTLWDCAEKLKVSATMLAFCRVNIHLCPQQLFNAMTHIPVSPTLSYRTQVTTCRMEHHILAQRMHFEGSAEELNEIPEVHFTEIVARTEADLEGIPKLLRQLFVTDAPCSYCQYYLQFQLPAEKLERPTIQPILQALPPGNLVWWATGPNKTRATNQWILRIAAIPGESAKDTPEHSSSKSRQRPLGKILHAACTRISQQWKEEKQGQRVN